MRIICYESSNWTRQIIELNRYLLNEISEPLKRDMGFEDGYIKHELKKVYNENPKDVLKITIVFTVNTEKSFKETFIYTISIAPGDDVVVYNKGFGRNLKVLKRSEIKDLNALIVNDVNFLKNRFSVDKYRLVL